MYHVNDIFTNILALGGSPLVHIQQFEIESQAETLNNNIVGMQVAMIIAALMDALDATGEGMQQMQRLERCESLARLPIQELAQNLAFNKLGDKHGNTGTFVENVFLRVILNNDRAMAQLVQLFGVKLRRAIFQVAMGKEKFRRSVNTGCELPDQVDFTLPARTQPMNDLVSIYQNFTRLKFDPVYSLWLRFSCWHSDP